MNVHDQLKTIEVSALISCIASVCHVYMKFPLKINLFSDSFGKIQDFGMKYKKFQANIGNIANIAKS